MKQVKIILRSNVITCFLIYIFKYRIVNPIKYYLKYARVKFFKSSLKNTDLMKLSNTHLGESCIIVGNGPSLRLSDLDLIQKSGMDSFGANRILDLLDKTDWCPTYLSVMDPAFIIGVYNTCSPEEYIKQIENSRVKYAFLTNILEDKLPKSKRVIYIFSPLANLFSKVQMPFSTDSSKYVSDLGNVTPYSIQLAYYLGYRTIYLYGMDNTYTKYLDNDGKFISDVNIISHAKGMKTNIDDERSSKTAKTKFQAYMLGGYSDKRKNDKGYDKCKEFAKNHNMKIINLTHGGALDVFDRADFYDVFDGK